MIGIQRSGFNFYDHAEKTFANRVKMVYNFRLVFYLLLAEGETPLSRRLAIVNKRAGIPHKRKERRM